LHHPRMVFSLLVVTFIFLIGVMSLLELAGARGATTRFMLVLFLFGSCLSLALRSRTMDVAAFLRGHRRMPEVFDAMASCANAVAGLLLAFLAAGGSFADPGFTAIVTGWAAGLFVFAFLIAAPLRASGANTLPEFFARRFDSRAARIGALLMLLAVSIGLLEGLLGVAGGVLRQLTGFSFATSVWWVAVFISLCVVLGGMRSVAWVQVALLLVLIICLVAPLLFIAFGAGSGESGDVAPATSGAGMGLPLAGLSLCMLAGTFAMPHIATRALASRTPASAGRAAAGAMVVTAVLVLAVPFAGMPSGDAASAGFAFLPGLSLMATLAASMAMAAGILVTMANACGNEFVSVRQEGAGSDPVRMIIARLAGVLICAVAAWFATRATGEPVSDMIWSFSLAAATLAVPLLGAIWWQRATGTGAIVAMACGALSVAGILYYQRSGGLAWGGLDPVEIGLAGMAASLIGLVAGSLLSGSPDEEQHRRFEALHVSAERTRQSISQKS